MLLYTIPNEIYGSCSTKSSLNLQMGLDADDIFGFDQEI